jgi:DNA (cytosine-5)-methyltransferase 1
MITPEGIPVIDAFCHMLEKGGYASYEGLKHALNQMSNAWGVVKDQGRERSKHESQDGEEESVGQMSLF